MWSSTPIAARDTGRLALYLAQKTSNPPVIDGIPNDAAWQSTRWCQIDQPWLGDTISKEYCSGRFQVLWIKTRCISVSVMCVFGKLR